MSFICMRMKNHFHIKGWELNINTTQKFSFSKLKYGRVLSDSTPENFANIWKIKWNRIRSMKFETTKNPFLSDDWVCCHPEILILWQRDVRTSLYWKVTQNSPIIQFNTTATKYHVQSQNGPHTKISTKGYNSIASSVLFFSRRYEAYLASSASISLMLCCFASSIAWSHWFSWTQQSIASFTFPVCRNRNTKAS